MGQKRSESETPVEVDWESLARRVLKAELARVGVTYKVLAIRLEAIGVQDHEAAIANKISRGKFSFVFFMQCMRALSIVEIDLRDRTENK